MGRMEVPETARSQATAKDPRECIVGGSLLFALIRHAQVRSDVGQAPGIRGSDFSPLAIATMVFLTEFTLR